MYHLHAWLIFLNGCGPSKLLNIAAYSAVQLCSAFIFFLSLVDNSCQLISPSVICVLQAFLHPLSKQQPVVQQVPVKQARPQTPYGVQQHPSRHETHMAVNTHHAMHTPPAASENIAAPAPPAASGPAQPPQPLAVFEKIVDRLNSMFPHYSR